MIVGLSMVVILHRLGATNTQYTCTAEAGPRQQRTMRRIAMAMVSDGNGGELYDASIATFTRYADLHGYHFFVDRQNLVRVEDPERDGHAAFFYQKLVTLLKYTLKGLEDHSYDWLL